MNTVGHKAKVKAEQKDVNVGEGFGRGELMGIGGGLERDKCDRMYYTRI